jgi:hypothetical protein
MYGFKGAVTELTTAKLSGYVNIDVAGLSTVRLGWRRII